MAVGILAFGSLRIDAGAELQPLIVDRVRTATPFGVEFARLSRTRGNAPTLQPSDDGDPVDAEVLVLSDAVLADDARQMLWRRETNHVGTARRRPANSVVTFLEIHNCAGCALVLATDFKDPPLVAPDPSFLARCAIDSVARAETGRDGITYPRDVMAQGLVTRRTGAYRQAILAQTNTTSLDDALAVVRARHAR